MLVGFLNVGPGASFMAQAAQLALPASARLVFDPALLPPGSFLRNEPNFDSF